MKDTHCSTDSGFGLGGFDDSILTQGDDNFDFQNYKLRTDGYISSQTTAFEVVSHLDYTLAQPTTDLTMANATSLGITNDGNPDTAFGASTSLATDMTRNTMEIQQREATETRRPPAHTTSQAQSSHSNGRIRVSRSRHGQNEIHFCHYQGYNRSVAGRGYMRRDHLREHLRNRHDDTLPLVRSKPVATLGPNNSTTTTNTHGTSLPSSKRNRGVEDNFNGANCMLHTSSQSPLARLTNPITAPVQRPDLARIAIPGQRDVVVREYTIWQQSQVQSEELKKDYQKCCDLMQDVGLDLEQIHEVKDEEFSTCREVKLGIARRFVTDISKWAEQFK